MEGGERKKKWKNRGKKRIAKKKRKNLGGGGGGGVGIESPTFILKTLLKNSTTYFQVFFFEWKYILPFLREKDVFYGNQTLRANSGSQVKIYTKF